MPYEARGKCVYKKDGGTKVGCTKGSVKKYLAALHANANESIQEDVVKGGKADDMTPNDIAIMHGVPEAKILQQLKKGIKVEMEHVDTQEKAKEIAMDHLVELPDYYDRLNKMEKKAGVTENRLLIKSLLREEFRNNLK